MLVIPSYKTVVLFVRESDLLIDIKLPQTVWKTDQQKVEQAKKVS